jgi:hypothetical protein
MLSRKLLVRISAMACLTGLLGGCGRHYRETPGLGNESARSMGVLAELGIGQPTTHPSALPVRHRQGPCLIAGDGLAWRWAMAFDMAPMGYARPTFADASQDGSQ